VYKEKGNGPDFLCFDEIMENDLVSRWSWPETLRFRRAVGLRAGLAGVLLLWGASAMRSTGQEAGVPDSSDIFCIGFSSAIFIDLNESDVKAAMKVWTETIAKEIGIPTDPTPLMLEGAAALDAALRNGRVASAAMTSAEYLAMNVELQTGTLILPVSGGGTTEEYLLIVHRDSPVQQVKDLAGRSLVRLENPRASLAPIWLDVLLALGGLRGEACFSAVTRTLKASQAILQVFFRKIDACLVTRAGFEITNELNPQVGKQLRVLAASPEFVPQLYCFRPNYPPALRQKAVAAISKMHESRQGRQVLTTFKVDRLEEQSLDCLDSARELLATHVKLYAFTNRVQSTLLRATPSTLPQLP
jgi:ABC-type phosphate/phosphonate transport system substrate-binding protein